MTNKNTTAKGMLRNGRTKVAQAIAPKEESATPTDTRPAAKKAAAATPRTGRPQGNANQAGRSDATNRPAQTAQHDEGKSVRKFTPSNLNNGDVLVVTTTHGSKFMLIGTDRTAVSEYLLNDEHPTAVGIIVRTTTKGHVEGPAEVTYVRNFVEIDRALMYEVDDADPEKTTPVAKIVFHAAKKAAGSKPTDSRRSGKNKKA